jgi:hypothetical protein
VEAPDTAKLVVERPWNEPEFIDNNSDPSVVFPETVSVPPAVKLTTAILALIGILLYYYIHIY